MSRLTPEEEASQLLELYGARRSDALTALLSGHLQLLHDRAHVLLTLASIIVSTTGFSGRLIAGTNRWAQGAIIAGIPWSFFPRSMWSEGFSTSTG